MNICSLILCALLLTAPATAAAVESINNNFTMIDPGNNAFAGANDVFFSWDGTKKTSVAVSGQVSNAKISSSCPFFSVPWKAHDVAVYGPGAYTVYSGCPAGSPGCGTGVPIKFAVKKGEIGIHMLLDWNDSVDIDVVTVMKPNAAASPLWTHGCGSHSACAVWTWASYDFDGDGVNGTPAVEGPFAGMNVNFNLGAGAEDPCCDAAARCNDNNACTTDTCDRTTGLCVHTPMDCDDNNVCTVDSCDPKKGCVHTPTGCEDNNACTVDSCSPAAGCVHTPKNCDDNNACTTDSCNQATGCVFTPIGCDDNNVCTIDSCDPVRGCLHTAIVCDDKDACTLDTCDPAHGCVFTPVKCPDNRVCEPATGNCIMTHS